MSSPEEPAENPLSPPSPPPPASVSTTSNTATRSYDCTFCKMGFSNAQALGGHMNIHRKQRAKVQQPPADFPVPADAYVPNHPTTNFQWPTSLESRHGSTYPERTVHAVERLQLPLFAEAPFPREDRLPAEGSDDCTTEPDVVGLDLELRLGTEPPPDGASSRRDNQFIR